MGLAAIDDFFFIIKQIMIDEGPLEFVADEWPDDFSKESRIVPVEEEVELVADLFIIDL